MLCCLSIVIFCSIFSSPKNREVNNFALLSVYRGSGIDSGWLGLDDAGPSTGIRSGGLGRVQTVMRHLAAVGETYAQTALEDAAWNLWSMRASQAGTSSSAIPPAGNVRHVGGAGGLHLRTPSRATNNNVSNIYTMVETVREVLPHIPDEIILEVWSHLFRGFPMKYECDLLFSLQPFDCSV